MNVKLAQSFTFLLLCVNICVAYKFYNPSATVTIDTVTYTGVQFYADTALNAQQLVYPTNPNAVTETEMYSNNARYQICGPSSCSAFYLPYTLPNYALTSLSVTTSNVKIGPSNNINTNYYRYTDSEGFLVELWAVPNSNPVNIVQVKQSGQGLNRKIYFGLTNDFATTKTLSAPDNTQYPGCASKIQCGSAMDIVLVVDTSGSIDPADYITEKNYVQSVVESFDVSTVGVHVGYVTFSTAAFIRSNLTSNEAQVLNVIQNAAQDFGETNIGGAINAAYDVFTNTGRPNVPQVIILLTDGNANIPSPAGTATQYMTAAATKAKNAGMLIYAIGVGSQLDTQLQLIASGPSYISNVANFAALSSTLSSILQTVCVGGDSNACASGCANTQFCGCQSCLCAQSSSVCAGRGNFNTDTCACECTGNWENIGSKKDCSDCQSLTCAHGTKDTTNCMCKCYNKWTGNTCSDCPVAPCTGNTYNQTDCQGCACTNFWSGADCLTCDNNLPTLHCHNGGTILYPETCSGCSCPGFYTAVSNCQTCNAGCKNGKAILPGCTGCDCSGTNWSGPKCDSCALNCNNGAVADLTKCNSCNCNGYYTTASNCLTCNTAFCKNGGSMNLACNKCSCTGNWGGDDCNTCGLTCGTNQKPNTDCTACVCVNNNYNSATNCLSCVTNVCVNGYLNYTDSCQSCVCNANTTGTTCNQCISDAVLCNNRGNATDSTCTACTCSSTFAKFATGTFCETCDTSKCLHGSTMKSSCNACNCKKGWSGDPCDTCTRTNYAILSAPCVNGTLSDSCVSVYPLGSTTKLGNLCYNTNSLGFLQLSFSASISDIWVWIDTDATNINLNSPATFYSTRTPIATIDLTIGTTYFAVVKIKTRGGSVGYSAATGNTPAPNTLEIQACDDCVCNLNCNNGHVNSTACDTCTCDDYWSGVACDQCNTADTNTCNGHGHLDVLAGGKCGCVCDPNWGGANCETCQFKCQNGGSPITNTCNSCTCPGGWGGADCSVCVESKLCNSHGTISVECSKCNCETNFGGDRCDVCTLDCNNHGQGVFPNCNTCVCNDPWTGSSCLTCSDTLLCNGKGTATDATCSSCNCLPPWGGNNCEECQFSCNGNGQPANPVTCNSCTCNGAYTVDSNCATCDTSANSVYCNNRGTINNGDTACDSCTCKDFWGGKKCERCTLQCNNGTSNSPDCSACVCVGQYTPESNCLTCPLICNNGGKHNRDCTACQCVNGWGGANCDVCVENPANCKHGSTLNPATCSCDCVDQWSGRLCNICSNDTNPCNYPDQGFLLTEINNVTVCKCACAGYWKGEACGECTLNPLYGDATCGGTRVVDLTTCTCHCPKYYNPKDESCKTCIITPADCVHPLEVGQPVDLTNCNCGPCKGNYVGRDCSECGITSCQRGSVFNPDTCNCDIVCGNDIISGDEQCEVGLMNTVDQVCCTDCQFNSSPCDDQISCTYDDMCVSGTCSGLSGLDFTTDQNRKPMEPGVIPPDAFSRLGITITSESTVPVLYDTSSNARSNLLFPNPNVVYGGDNDFGLVIVQQTIVPASSICLNFATPLEYTLASILGVSKDGTLVSMFCGNSQEFIHIPKKWTSIGGYGGVEYINIPCGSNGLSKICYLNLNDAAIGPLTSCGTADLPLGTIGDFVWSDYNRDNVQDSGEPGISGASVNLYGENDLLISTTRTNANGLYLFSNLYAGNYKVSFTGPTGWVFSTPLTLDSVFSNRGSTDSFVLSQGQTDLTRDAGLYFSGQIGDYVWNDKNQDGIQNSATEPGVPGVVVNLYYSEDTSKIIKTTTTDAAGFYIFNDLLIIKSANTYYSYTVEVIPPPKAVITAPYQGTSATSDSNFDVNTHLSNSVVLGYTTSTRSDVTIDCGIYYCCGSIGDYVWFDTNKDGIQDISESGASSVTVVLYWNGAPRDTTTTDASGYYLFSGLPLIGEYVVHFSKPSPASNYIFTKQTRGTDREKDSDVDVSGISGKIYLTEAVPDVRSVDAGVVEGCTVNSDCAASDNKCFSATCNAQNKCVYVNSITCQTSTDPCTLYQCNPNTGNCDLIATGNTCDDGNLCTSSDKCTINGCKGTPNTLTCDDSNSCTTNDICSAGRCTGTTRNCPSSLNQCKTTLCDPVRGCYEENLADNTPCSDGSLCTEGDVCKSGICVAGPRVTCQPNDACHTYACSEATGQCVTTILTDANCNDRNDCTDNDKCTSDGICTGTPKVCSQVGLDQCHTSTCSNGICVNNFIQRGCDDNNPCTINDACVRSTSSCKGTPKFCPAKACQDVICNSITGDCQYTPNNALSCTDDNPCTVDACVNGRCVNTPIKCDDSNPCTEDECVGGECRHPPNFNSCDDSNPCTERDTCSGGSCNGTPKNCDDGEICTEDTCVAGNCVHNPVPSTTVCDDGNKCTPHSYCVSGKCQGYDSVICDDNNVCTDDICDLLTGQCSFTYNESPCNDNDACTQNGKCSLGKCISEPVNCEPVENVCLLSVCANGQCSYQPDPSATTCDDYSKCTVDDKCVSGVCTGTPLECKSPDVCHDANCLVDQGCVITPNQANCDDNNPCTVNDVCSNGACAGTPLVCNDNNPCTDDVCRNGVCVYTPNSEPCSDKNPCTLDDICSNSQCVPGASTICDDSNVCTVDKCNLVTGECEFSPVAGGSCNDFNPCTTDDICLLSGECHGTPKVCTGANPCLDYFCNSRTGQCESKPNTAVCEDNDPCTSSSRCSNGECVGVPVVCPDLTDCITSVCDASQNGICVPSKLTGKICSDNNACTKDDICTDGVCTGTPDTCSTSECNVDTDCTPIDKCHTVTCQNNQCVYDSKSCPPTANPCTSNVCSLSTGECTVSNVPGSCDDGDKCTLTDVCVLGVCVGTNPKRCSTSASCRKSTCNSSTGNCDITIITDNVTPCDDSNSCTLTDVCTVNGCVGSPVTCNDNNLCTTDSCVDGACSYVNNINTCSDGNACTSNDYCSSGQCNPGTLLNCDDRNVCTADSCVAGECSHLKLSFTSCDDGNKCTTQDTCTNGECSGVTTLCDDNDPCTLDSCDPTTGFCVHSPAEDGVSCDDNDLCTNDDVCKSGECTGTTYCPPADAILNECVSYSCDPKVGGCVREFTTNSCTNDKNCFKTSGVCSSGECISDPVVCNDNLFCTVDTCNPDTGLCEFKNNNVTCSPTVPDLCHEYICINSICSAVNPKNCDDKNSCTRDFCLNGECKHEALPFTPCSDGDACTLDDLCTTDGTCVGTPRVCADDNVCTDDVCIQGECVFQANEAVCTSTAKCATASRCSNKECVVTANLVCPPRDCYDAQCNPSTGACEYTANDALTCSDDKICTNDFCRAGVCQHTEVTCTRGNAPCVDYVCDNAAGGCITRPNNALPCADSDLCTIDSCSNGECVHSPKVCADDNLCTYGSYCNSTDGSCGGNVPYSCRLSPCLNYNCVGDGTCVLASFSSTYQPIVYLSVIDGNDPTAARNKIIALNATRTNAIYYVANFNVPLNSIDIDPVTGVVYDVGPAISGRSVSINRLSRTTNSRIQSKAVNPLISVPPTVSSLTISLRPKFVSITDYYTHEIWGFDKVTDTFYVYSESGTVISSGVYAGPIAASLISWDHYGRSAFYFKNNDKTIYLWQLDSSGHSFSVALCNNVNFGTGTIVAIDTAVDGTLWVGTTNPVALFVVTPVLSSVCPYSNLSLPTNVTVRAVTLLSLTVDNTFCPVAATTGIVVPPPTTTTTTTGVVPPPPVTTTTGGSPAAPVSGNLVGGAASGSNPAFPGQDTNYPLTGTTGYATTAVVGTVAGVAVLFAAIFGAVLGLNTAKEDKTVPLDQILTTQDVQSVASDSPIFIAPNLVQQNVLNA